MYIKIEMYTIHKTAGERHPFPEFKTLFPLLKDAEKAYIAIGGTLPKAKKPKASDKE
jgi:hypothetical protein